MSSLMKYSSTREEKFGISKGPYDILFIIVFINTNEILNHFMITWLLSSCVKISLLGFPLGALHIVGHVIHHTVYNGGTQGFCLSLNSWFRHLDSLFCLLWIHHNWWPGFLWDLFDQAQASTKYEWKSSYQQSDKIHGGNGLGVLHWGTGLLFPC